MAWIRRICMGCAVLACSSALLAADGPSNKKLQANQPSKERVSVANLSTQVHQLATRTVESLKKQWIQEKREWKFWEIQEGKPAERSGRGGGDTCAVATVIPSVPYTDSGTTVGAADNYNEVCPYTNTGAPDVVYQFSPASNVTVDISLCVDSAVDTNYDSKIYIYDNVCPAPNSGSFVACNDDSCSSPAFSSYVSSLSGVSLLGGHTYYIVIDGYSAVDSGNYTMVITGALPPPGCPANTLFGQPPSTPSQGWTFGVADDDFDLSTPPGTDGIRRYENFSGVGGAICDIHFWGIPAWNDGFGFVSCSENPMNFQIEFYPDNAGTPGPAACSYTLSIPGTATGQLFAGFEMLEYSANLPTCCNLTSGWVQIQGTDGDSTCWFLWASSGNDGDPGASSLIDETNGSGIATETFDLAVCLTGTVQPGACCDSHTASCDDNVNAGDCTGDRFVPGVLCADLNPVCGGVAGACCDDVNGTCNENVLPANCTGRHAPGQTCAQMDPVCGEALGACCFTNGSACQQLSGGDCEAAGGSWNGVGSPCSTCPCVVACPPGSVAEQDACGEDTNSGCNVDPAEYQDITVGDTICGTIDASTSLRDTDWYRFTTTQSMILTVSAEGEFEGSGLNLAAGLLEYLPGHVGTGNCADFSGFLNPFFTAAPCTPGSASTECLPAGTYVAFASVDDFLDLPCGLNNDYHITVTGTPCVLPTAACCGRLGDCTFGTQFDCDAAGGEFQFPGSDCNSVFCPPPLPGDLCEAPIVVNVPANLPYATSDTTCGRIDDVSGTTCLGNFDGGEDIFYQLNVTATTSVHITMDPNGTDWTGIALDDSCPPDSACIAVVSSSTTAPRDLGCRTLTPGTYTIMIDTWPAPDCIPSFNLNISTCVPQPGRCCLPDETCQDIVESACLLAGGAWTEGTDCNNTCPTTVGEDCPVATVVPSVPYTANFDNTDAAQGAPGGSCNSDPSLMTNDVWFEYTPAATCTATVSVDQPDYDGISVVWSGTCGMLTEETCLDEPQPQTYSFVAQAGVHYFFQIGDWGTFPGGGATTFHLECSAGAVGECCINDTCSILSQDDCNTAGGTGWHLGGDCNPDPCAGGVPADLCDDAVNITSLPYQQAGIDSGSMTDDPNANPSCDSSFSCVDGPANNGWWYTITPTSDCSINVAKSGGIDSVTSLYTGPDCNNLTHVPGACADDPESTAAFSLTGGTTYWILISNYSCSFEPTSIVTVDVTGNCTFVCGDLAPPAGDGVVGLPDYLAFVDAFGSCTGGIKYNPEADFDSDGCVTWVDYQYWLQCYRNYIGNPTAGPPGGKNPLQLTTRKGATLPNNGPVHSEGVSVK